VNAARRTLADYFVSAFAMAAIVLHDTAHLHAGRWYDVFWVCNLAALLVGPGVLLRSPALCQIALTWLAPGTLVWLLDVAVAGSNVLPTSWGVHLGGTACAAYGVRRSGVLRLGWLWALAFFGAAVALAWLFVPSAHNVNAAHGVPVGWSFLGGSRVVFSLSAGLIAVTFCALGQLFARALWRRWKPSSRSLHGSGADE
jgi:hypothetical protein